VFQRQTAAIYTALVASKTLRTASGALIQKQIEIILIESRADFVME